MTKRFLYWSTTRAEGFLLNCFKRIAPAIATVLLLTILVVFFTLLALSAWRFP